QNRTGASRRIRLFASCPEPHGPEARCAQEFLPRKRLTPARSRIREPLRSMPITALRRYYEFIRPWDALRDVRPRGSTPWTFSLPIATPGSQVTGSSPLRNHATEMPDATLAVSGLRQR